jgi:C1A family cysteine protease
MPITVCDKYPLRVEYGMMPEKIKDYSITTVLPSSLDLRSKMPIMYDQGNIGSCTANALCYNFIFNDNTYVPSRLFLYYNSRMLDKTVNNDVGSTLTQGIIALQKYGVCSEKLWPYIVSKYTNKPPQEAYVEGEKHQILESLRVQQTMTSMKGCLNSGFPFVLGILIYSSFEGVTVSKTGFVPMPNQKTERILGGHAVICIGYNDLKSVWIMKNSWGDRWGDNGYFYLPYNYLLSNKLAGDMWTIKKVEVLSLPRKIMVNKALEVSKHLKKVEIITQPRKIIIINRAVEISNHRKNVVIINQPRKIMVNRVLEASKHLKKF